MLYIMIPEEHIKALSQFPVRLQHLVQAELAAGNSIVEIRSGYPAPPEGACLELSMPLLSRPRFSDRRIRYYIRKENPNSGEISISIESSISLSHLYHLELIQIWMLSALRTKPNNELPMRKWTIFGSSASPRCR